MRFLISARGGNGGDGGDGYYGFRYHFEGYDGGAAGYGGRVEVWTGSAPWRDYLDVDVRPGVAGKGGAGLSVGTTTWPSGRPGTPGQPGQVITRISDD